jgi:hypothetical protein
MESFDQIVPDEFDMYRPPVEFVQEYDIIRNYATNGAILPKWWKELVAILIQTRSHPFFAEAETVLEKIHNALNIELNRTEQEFRRLGENKRRTNEDIISKDIPLERRIHENEQRRKEDEQYLHDCEIMIREDDMYFSMIREEGREAWTIHDLCLILSRCCVAKLDENNFFLKIAYAFHKEIMRTQKLQEMKKRLFQQCKRLDMIRVEASLLPFPQTDMFDMIDERRYTLVQKICWYKKQTEMEHVKKGMLHRPIKEHLNNYNYIDDV